MQIVRDFVNEQFFREKIWQNSKLDKASVIHATDLVYCLRKAWFRLKGIEPSDPHSSEFMVIGKTLHSIIENAFNFKEVELKHPRLNIQCTIDLLENNIPIEVKTTRKKIESADQIPPSYIEQLLLYMTALETRCGYLAILNVIKADLQLFRFDLNEIDYVETLEKFSRRKQCLEHALKNDTFADLPKLEWQCRTCEYRGRCNGQTSVSTMLSSKWSQTS